MRLRLMRGFCQPWCRDRDRGRGPCPDRAPEIDGFVADRGLGLGLPFGTRSLIFCNGDLTVRSSRVPPLF